MSDSVMTRGEVSRLLGVSTKTLSAWEREGKIPPPTRDWRGWRGYTREQVKLIQDRLTARLGRGRAGTGPLGAGPERVVPLAVGEAAAPHILSARNRLRGTVVRLDVEGLMAEVTLRLDDGQEIVAVITRSSVNSLSLRVGEEAVAVIKSTEVMIGR